MLTRSEFTLLREQFALALMQGDPKNRIRTYFGPDATALLKEIPANLSTYDEYANEVIIYCLQSRWAIDPSLMETLLVKLLSDGLSEGTTEMIGVLDRGRLRIDPNDACYDALWVLNNQPFLNRHTLRPLLKDFLRSNDRSLLRISGQGAGRTYTKELFDYLATQIEGLHCVPIELKAKSAPSYKVQTLAAEMLNPMGEDVPASSSSSDAAELSRLFLRTIKKQPGIWLFVLDGFGQEDVHPDLKDLIEILAAKCITPEYRRKMRLILVNFDAEFEGILPAAIADDDIPLPSVTRSDLVDCLTQLNVLRVKEGLAPLDGVSTIADAMLAAAPVPAAEGSEGEEASRAREKVLLRYLYDRLRKVAGMRGGQNG
jgi:hypothetical protein